MIDERQYHDNHYAEMLVQPIEVMQATMSPEAFHGLLEGNIVKYQMRRGHKAGEGISKELDKRDRYIAWMYHASRGFIIDPRQDYECPLWYKQNVINCINKKVAELEMARKYGENN